ncbi:hypothetical protein COLO4_09281 [Corchorus olitorius]|uniref:Uncharacterized protein n=1 Tax=Corchorus olitorius TaxID=93759 RepID=A0A1R3KCI5_9ROSI|nr:hypothetical protein COLO4_09281 [Corchorus olitorius]
MAISFRRTLAGKDLIADLVLIRVMIAIMPSSGGNSAAHDWEHRLRGMLVKLMARQVEANAKDGFSL